MRCNIIWDGIPGTPGNVTKTGDTTKNWPAPWFDGFYWNGDSTRLLCAMHSFTCGNLSCTTSCVTKMARPRALLMPQCGNCLLYTSDAADDLLCVDLGGR